MTKQHLTTVDFHGAKLIARPGDTPAETLVAMKPVVEGMGLDWGGQHKKLIAHPILSQGISVIAIPSAGGPQEMTALPLNRLNFWLATVQPDRLTDEATRAKVIAYQTECADVLFDHFFPRTTDLLTPASCQELRTLLGLTRKALAELSGFPANTIALFENDGMVFSPDSQAIVRRALDVAAAQLRKAGKPTPAKALPAGGAPVGSPMVKLEFSVPAHAAAHAAAKVCAFVAKVTEAKPVPAKPANASRGE